jgi:hypothetical protein
MKAIVLALFFFFSTLGIAADPIDPTVLKPEKKEDLKPVGAIKEVDQAAKAQMKGDAARARKIPKSKKWKKVKKPSPDDEVPPAPLPK